MSHSSGPRAHRGLETKKMFFTDREKNDEENEKDGDLNNGKSPNHMKKSHTWLTYWTGSDIDPELKKYRKIAWAKKSETN